MGHEPEEDSFLTVADVAELLKLNQQTVRNWIDQGSLPALKVGRRVRIRRSDLDRVLEQGRTTSVGAPRASGPNAQDFWSGAPVGVAEIDPEAETAAASNGRVRDPDGVRHPDEVTAEDEP
jgi:excisionase family DNA binding protein